METIPRFFTPPQGSFSLIKVGIFCLPCADFLNALRPDTALDF